MTNELPQETGQFMSAAATLAGPVLTPLSNDCKYDQELPCEKYRQFIDSTHQERSFMIEKLVETFANVIDSIWHPKFIMENPKVKIMPTKGFCNEILKRSKATYSTLQISLFYIFRVKKVVHEKLYQRYKNKHMPTNSLDDLMCCGRRMFLASLMVASKYLHDKNYHNKAWAKITGLDIKEINAAELAFLKLIDYRLHVSKPTFDKWYTQLHGHIQKGYKSALIQPQPQPQQLLSQQQQQQQTPPLSPPSENYQKTFVRADSGVSFDLLSPPSPSSSFTGLKRKQLMDSDVTNKRICQ